MIECRLENTRPGDIAFWVPHSDFKNHFDQSDFIDNRDAEYVVDAYSNEWFYTDLDGKLVFELPAVGFVDGKTQFISGRHRISVLIGHIDVLPISFAPSAIHLANKLNLVRVDMNKNIVLPTLPKRAF